MTEEKKELNQLVIIGNGFDLRCGLSSKYQDFFKQRYNFFGNEETYKSLEMVPNIINQLPDHDVFSEHLGQHNFSCLTLWDVIIMNVLYGHHQKMGDDWSDFEGLIVL